ncbi:MAG: hypothetical protein KGN78_05065 [Actinomycetales bacterium]|nr:hypothetical protein [Actinomycetales bacterium]
MAIYYVRRDNLGNVTDAQARQYARLLSRTIGHDVEFADHSGCNCEDRETREDHRYDAQRVFEDGAWWVGHDGWWEGKR